MASNTDPNLNHPLAQPNPHRVILGPQPYPGPSSIVSALLSTATQSPAQRDLLALYASGLNSPLNPLESPQAYMNSPSGGTSPLSAAGPLAALLGGSTNTSAQSNLSSLASQVGAQSCQPLPIMEVSSAGLTALALHSVVVVTTAVPPVRVITTLDEHVTLITALAWSHHVLNLESDRTSLLQLASGDLQGNLIVWNVAQPHTQLTRFSGAELKLGAVLDVQWMRARHARHLVAAVHYPNHLVMYNTLTSSVVWKIELPDPIISLHLNPFDAQQACLATPHGGIFVVKDFKVDAAPRLVELKYKINSQGSDATLKSDYVQMCFSPHHRHIVFFLLEKRILVFDLSLNQSVAVMLLDRNRPALKQLCLSSHSPNLLFCLHEENLVTAWKRRDSSDTYQFELCASLDLTRHNKTAKKKSSLIYSMALSPLSDRYLFVTSSDGSV
jgi:WD40 repeat protein